jgi:predicted ATP-binding protein involved in virulence
VIFVGENGTGKSLVLAYIVNCLLWGKQLVFEDTEVESRRRL